MKRFVSIILVISLFACKKDTLQPRFEGLELYKGSGSELVNLENNIDAKRTSSNPADYNLLANEASDKFVTSWQNETPSQLSTLIEAYQEVVRDHPKRGKKRLWKHTLRVAMSDEVYRVMPGFSEMLLKKLKSYCEYNLNGPIQEVNGTRQELFETQIKNIFDEVNPDSQWGLTYKEELRDYFLNFAQSAKNRAQYNRNGLLNSFHWRSYKKKDKVDD